MLTPLAAVVSSLHSLLLLVLHHTRVLASDPAHAVASTPPPVVRYSVREGAACGITSSRASNTTSTSPAPLVHTVRESA